MHVTERNFDLYLFTLQERKASPVMSAFGPDCAPSSSDLPGR